jgi:hypothetical protein
MENIMNLEQALQKIITEWPKARHTPFRENTLAQFIRTDFPAIIEKAIGVESSKYIINGSPGAGNWASVPWLAILDKDITNTSQKGFYPVYLFREDMSGIYLSLNQGTTYLMKQLGRVEAMNKAKQFSAALRSSITDLVEWSIDIELGSNTQLGSSYEPPNIGAKFYPANAIPNNATLEIDLKELLDIYQIAKEAVKNERKPIKLTEIILSSIPKPFLLLAGISGTGKTRWVRERELEGEGNVELIPVRPDWHEPSDLLGYVSRISGLPVFVPTPFLAFIVKAWRNAWKSDPSLNASSSVLAEMLPFWLCLDEMNLAPVEQYFADYLSVLELRRWADGLYSCPPLLRIEADLAETKRTALGMDATDPLWRAFAEAGGIPLPPNLIVVGTVNMDETTHAFSRKVLDRALTVEFDAVDFGLFGGARIDGHASASVPWDGISSVTDSRDLDLDEGMRSAVIGLLESWNGILAQTPFRIAYRTINEALLIAGSLPDAKIGEVLDWVAMTKLLPRLEGDEDKLGLDRDGGEVSYFEKLGQDWQVRFGDAWAGSRSKAKLDFMSLRLKRSGYSSFWP